MKNYRNLFNKIVEPEHLFNAWDEFKHDKRSKADVQEFEKDLERNIFDLSRDLKNKKYKHGPYTGFYIYDPKLRHIHKAMVRDRVLHHAVFEIVNKIFEPTFIANSFSCRIGKGTHKGVEEINKMIRKASKNYTQPCFALKCDVRKFFDSIDHNILLSILEKRIKDKDMIWLLTEIIGSYQSSRSDLFHQRGLPIGNLTSQIFANVYMNIFDQFVKHELKAQYYARYTDDFIIIAHSMSDLLNKLNLITTFLEEKLALGLHPQKIIIRRYNQGIDFLGYVVFPHHKLVRTKTKLRILKKLRYKVKDHKAGKISEESLNQSLQSYLGVLAHANTSKLKQDLLSQFWLWRTE